MDRYQYLGDSIYDILDLIRKKPGLYLGVASINRLDSFLNGYSVGCGRSGVNLQDSENFHLFHDWVAQRLGFYESTSGWCNMILSKSANEEDAFMQFFALLDEFRKSPN